MGRLWLSHDWSWQGLNLYSSEKYRSLKARIMKDHGYSLQIENLMLSISNLELTFIQYFFSTMEWNFQKRDLK